MNDSPRVASIVVNWNGAHDLPRCLDSLLTTDYASHQVLVVDNGSTDGSLDLLRSRYPEVEVLALGENRGYAGGLNRGVAGLGGSVDAYFFLNPDVRVGPRCLPALAAAAARHERLAVAGPAIYDPEDPDRLLAAGSLLRRWTLVTEHLTRPASEVRDVPFVTGSAFLVPRWAYDALGPFDESFFLYYDEVDYCLRAQEQGHRTAIVPEARAWHRDVWSRHAQRPHHVYFVQRGRLRLLRKHGNPLQKLFQAFYLPTVHVPYKFLELTSVWRTPQAFRLYLDAVIDGLAHEDPRPHRLALEALLPHPAGASGREAFFGPRS